MAVVAYTDNPSITDTVLFTLLTPDSNGCFTSDPYKVDNLTIYYVERNFGSGNLKQYDQATYQEDKLQAAIEAETIACENPTDDNIASAKRLRDEANSTSTINPFYYNEATPVQVVGTNSYPAWLSTDESNAFITHVTEDSEGNPVYGQFTYEWNPTGNREGDYFICWTWTPLPAGDSISQNAKFSLVGNTVVTTSIPTHFTQPEKYSTLLTAYIPDMFKMRLSDDDLTPDVLDKFNQALALGFTDVEDLANQLVDLLDANSTHELFLPLLSNFFGIKLKSGDPTLWRRQIKNAIKLYKKKGTKKGLIEALDQAGIKMVKLTKLWQVVSPYTWQESFVFEGNNDFVLEKLALPLDTDNFGLWLRTTDSDEYLELNSDYVYFSETDGVTTMTWVGDSLSINPIDLSEGDILLVLYKYKDIPGSPEQTIENYTRSLPLADQRDEREQSYPLKNWNVRLIEEDDPFFDLVIPNRHPYVDPLVFGKIRTEFAYSENAYNKDEYDGSLRDSKNPCDIDKYFLDPCTACQSSKFNIDLEIENLSNDRILEAQDVITEFVPFHAVLHTMNFTGGVNEFIQSPIENIEMLVQVSGEEFVISGEGQSWFNRAMKRGTTTQAILRNQVATGSLALSSTGTAYNQNIIIFSPDIKFDNIGMKTDGTAILNIMSPSPNAGSYTLSEPSGNSALMSSATEPLNTSSFTFRVSNLLSNGTLCNVTQDNLFTFQDSSQNFGILGVKSTWDVDYDDASGAWSVYIPAYSATPFVVENILSDGSLILTNNGSLPSSNTNNIIYTLRDENGNDIVASTIGELNVRLRGRITSLDTDVQDVRNLFKPMVQYVQLIGVQYQIIGFNGTVDEFYIDGWAGGDMAGTNLEVYHRLVDNQIGYLGHRGLKLLVSGVNLETDLEIQNGVNGLDPDSMTDVDRFKENFLIVIGSDYYFISDIDGNSPAGSTTITLAGPDNYWTTYGGGGTSVSFSIYRYVRNSLTIPGQQFDLPEHTFPTMDRGGREVITRTDEEGTTVSIQSTNNDAVVENISQQESVSFTIQWADGSVEQGEL